MPRIAVVDIGTNSIKLLIARAHRTEHFRTEHFSRVTTRIGGWRDEPMAVRATADGLAGFKKSIFSRGCQHVFAFGTHALRTLEKTESHAAGEIMRRLEKAIGVPIRILAGKEEARYAYASAKTSLPLKKPHAILIDVGGGSTEMVVAELDRVLFARSLPLGALDLTKRFIHSDPIDKNEFLKLTEHVDRAWRRAIREAGLTGRTPATIDLAASGGTIGSLALMIAGLRSFPKQRHRKETLPSKISLGQLSGFLDRCLALPLRKRKRLVGLEPERADIICAGLAIVLSLMRIAKKRVLYPNRGGVREGALIHLLQNGLRW